MHRRRDAEDHVTVNRHLGDWRVVNNPAQAVAGTYSRTLNRSVV